MTRSVFQVSYSHGNIALTVNSPPLRLLAVSYKLLIRFSVLVLEANVAA